MAPLGAGGMGEVYRARDSKLKREVAIKILPEAFAADPDRLARFQREAELLAALNHPNIASVYGLEESNGVTAIVLELVEGETLDARVKAGAPTNGARGFGRASGLPLDDALPIARQIADALEAAHEKGVVHRDLKPANIKVTPEGKVKVLDFGLAKLVEAGGAGEAGKAGRGEMTSLSPTLSVHATFAGVILGTAAYMSPEQARGKPVDRRTDIWAFGCVLYEMLTGRQAFDAGETVSDAVAAILKNDPDWSALPGDTPTAIRRLLRRCLKKDPRERLRDIGDARIEIDEAGSEPAGNAAAPTVPVASRRREYVWATTSLVLFLTTAAVLMRLVLSAMPTAPTVRFEVFPPAGASLNNVLSMSPDGRTLAFVANSESKNMIWIRPIDSSTAEPLRATEGSPRFFWSADSQSIAFIVQDKVKKIAIAGGPAQVICNLPQRGNPSGAWSADGVILLGSEPGGGLFRVPASGGQPTPVTELDASRRERGHGSPSFLPDGRHYFYFAVSDNAEDTVAYVGALDSKERHRLPGIASNVQYSPTGHVVFVRDGTLMAQRFDVSRLELSGDAVPLAEQVSFATGPGGGPFSVSMNGGLAYKASGGIRNTLLAWFDRTGKQLAIAGPKGEYFGAELSPDDKYVAFARGHPEDIWVLDLEKGLTFRFTSHAAVDRMPVWSPDGRTILFESSRNGSEDLYQRTLGAVGEDTLVLKSEPHKIPSDWSRDGRYLAYVSENDIWALPVSGDRKPPLRVTETPFSEASPKISPDGRWMAYSSNESGGDRFRGGDVYIQSFPQPGAKQQVSTRGGFAPRWSRDGKELFYVAADLTIMTVSIKPAGSSLHVGVPTPLFKPPSDGSRRDYSVSADGRFLVNVVAAEPATPITIVFNWASGLKK